MRSGLLSSSHFGKFYEDKKEPTFRTVQLDKCRLTLNSERLYLLDSAGKLACLNLKDKALSTLPNCTLQHFHPDSHSSLALTAISPSSQILHVHFDTKKVSKVFNPCLNALVSFQKNYLTETILLAEAKTVLLVDGNHKIKSNKAANDDLIVSACLVGINRFVAVLLRSGTIEIRETSTLKLYNYFKLPFVIEGMKITASTCGKTIAVYGKGKWLFVLGLDDQGQLLCRLAELPFQQVIQLQFSYSQQMVLLGSDRVLYGVYYQGETGTLRPIFNHTQKCIPTGFDLSIDEKLIAVIAGKVVYLVTLDKGLRKVINTSEGIAIDFSMPTAEQHFLVVGREIQYEDQELRNNKEEEVNEKKEEGQNTKEKVHEKKEAEEWRPLKWSPPRNLKIEIEGQEQQEGRQNLQQLLQRQQRLKQALRNIRSHDD